MSTSQKHKSFVSEPISQKVVEELPGIGEKLGERLKAKGYDKAYVEWLSQTCGANSKQSGDCYTALKDWCSCFIF
ncbi:unnamed protein product [Trichobilharzia regenti]|nr:unnamed protein product [Trichobilharzia regenti]